MDFFELGPGGEEPHPVAHSDGPHRRLAAFLAFDDANYITGQTIYSDVGEPPSGCYVGGDGRLSIS